MGIDFYCGDITFGCGYGHWNEIKIQIIKATIDYIQDKYDKDRELYGHLKDDDENYIGEGSSYYFFMKYLMQLKKTILSQKLTISVFGVEMDNTVNVFIKLCNNLQLMNALNNFDIGGLFALCNQSDFDGYYTPGNSSDICSLFDRIEPFVKKYECYDCIYNKECRLLYEVFEYSYKKMKKVTIS